MLDHVRRLAEAGFARGIRFVERIRSLAAAGPGQSRQAGAGLPQPRQERRRGASTSGDEPGRIVLHTAFRPGVRLSVPGPSTRVALPLVIEIEDNGAGVPDHMKPHLFDPFVTTKRTGTGLGLALVAKIIGDHGGIIECDSEPQTHRVPRPAADAGAPARKTPPPAQSKVTTMARGTILVADDDTAIRTVLNQALARAGYIPRATGNAATLWRWVSRARATSSSPT